MEVMRKKYAQDNNQPEPEPIDLKKLGYEDPNEAKGHGHSHGPGGHGHSHGEADGQKTTRQQPQAPAPPPPTQNTLRRNMQKNNNDGTQTPHPHPAATATTLPPSTSLYCLACSFLLNVFPVLWLLNETNYSLYKTSSFPQSQNVCQSPSNLMKFLATQMPVTVSSVAAPMKSAEQPSDASNEASLENESAERRPFDNQVDQKGRRLQSDASYFF